MARQLEPDEEGGQDQVEWPEWPEGKWALWSMEATEAGLVVSASTYQEYNNASLAH